MPLAHHLILWGFFGGVAATLLILEDFTALALAREGRLDTQTGQLFSWFRLTGAQSVMCTDHMDTLKTTVAARVRAAIDAAGLTLLGLSEATGIPRTTLTRRLSGVSSFTVEELEALARELGTDVSDWMRQGAA